MDELTIARALHVIAIVHWIGCVTFVTLVVVPAIRRFADAGERFQLFEAVEQRFAAQARISVTVAGLTGLYMTHALSAWDRFLDVGYWWMHAMLLLWLAFTIVLFIAEPLFLHAWFKQRAQRNPAEAFALLYRGHMSLVIIAWITVGAAVLGAHGVLN